MLEESKTINACLRNKHICTLYEIFPGLQARDYPMIFKETFPNACLHDVTIAQQMIKHLYEPMNRLDRSALRATIIYAKNMLMRKIDLLKATGSGIKTESLNKSFEYLNNYLQTLDKEDQKYNNRL